MTQNPTGAAEARAPLSDAARFHEEIFLRSPDGILLLDAESERALMFNDAVCRQLGYSRAEFAELRIQDYAASEVPDAVRSHIDSALREGGAEFETSHRTKSGEIRHVHVWARRVDVAGRPAFYTIFRDVTDHRKADANLRDSLALLQQTGRLARVGGWQLDPIAQTLQWTPTVYRIHEVDSTFRPTVESAILFYAPDARPAIAAAVQAAIDHGTPFDLELPLVTAKGRRIWVRAQGTAERKDGRTIRVIGAFQDVTLRRRADESRHLQSAALHAAADAIVITDRDGTIEWVNPAFTKMTGYTADEARGKNPRDLVKAGKQEPAFYEAFWQTIVAGKTWQGEIVNRRKDGAQYTEEQSATPVADASGAIAHFIAIKRDMTARLQLEAQFLQSQKMESVGRFAGGIAHDFNNILTVINTRTDLALEGLGPDDPLREELQEVYRAGQRAAALTHQLLAFSRRQILMPTVVNLNAVTTGIDRMLDRVLGDDIEVIVDAAPDLLNVRADVSQLEQVLVNLAVNARDAMARGGRLTIETKNVTVDEVFASYHGVDAAPGPYVQLSVRDTGMGMDEVTRTHIFEPFFTTKGPGKGTGLGLSTVHGIVKQSGGFLGVQSEPGRGTVFHVYLPAVAEAASAPQEEPTGAVCSGTETILLVEDDAGLLKLARHILEAAGYTVLEAATGREALELLERRTAPVHLLLTDSMMPGVSGRQLAERFVQLCPDGHVLHMSGHTADDLSFEGSSDARKRFVAKPFTAPQLLRKVRELLDA